MGVKIGLNGFGRIGRYVTRILAGDDEVELVAVNARADNNTLAHLLKYDSVHGRFDGEVVPNDDGFLLNGKQIKVTRQAPGEWLWGDLGVDIVLETTGKFRDRESCEKHLSCGAKKVLIGAPGKNPDITIVMGVNDSELKAEHNIISNASCTTNCMAPPTKVIHENFGIVRGLMTTVHSYTMSQRILDGSHKDLRRARAAALSMIPTTTGAAKAVALVLPELSGKLNGLAVRVPTSNVSLIDLVVLVEKENATVEEVNGALKEASESYLANILGYSELPLVSVDFNGEKLSSVVDAPYTYVAGNLIMVLSWYDNETGYANRMIELAVMIGKKL